MKILKRTTAILFIFLFLLFPVGINMACPLPTYAADEWENVTKADLVTAFKYYCKSRNLAIEGSLADAITTFTTDTFNNIVNTLGIDSDAIQAELKKTTQGNLGLRFLFTQTGVNFYNRIFAEFLQNNDLQVGDTVDNKQVWSGKSFTDDNGNTAIVFEVERKGTWNIPIISYGSAYVYTNSELVNIAKSNTLPHNVNFNINNQIYTMKLTGGLDANGRGSLYWYGSNSQNTWWMIYEVNNSDVVTQTGYSAIIYDRLTSKLFLGSYVKASNGSLEVAYPSVEIVNGSADNATVNITTNNNTINNNDYSKDYTIIYNDGDYYDIDHNYPSPDTPPDGGGGGGGDNPDTPTPPDPPSSTPPDWPIELPDTDIDWIIRGMEERFPWDIPFNVMFALSLLNAEPETPHFEGTIDLKVVQWDYDIDLEPFDQIAEYFRKFFFFSFLVWLLLVTKKLIWG